MYKHFDSPAYRAELVNISRSLAEHIKEKNIKKLALVDRAARPAYVGFLKAWRDMYPEEKKPDVYFLNPEYLEKMADEKEKTPESYQNSLSKFGNAYGNLFEDKEKTMVFDNCVHTGRVAKPVKTVFDDMGANYSFGFVSKDCQCDYKVEGFRALDYVSYSKCWPFSHDRMIKKTPDKIYSEKNKDKKQRESSIQIRKEISQIFRELQ